MWSQILDVWDIDFGGKYHAKLGVTPYDPTLPTLTYIHNLNCSTRDMPFWFTLNFSAENASHLVVGSNTQPNAPMPVRCPCPAGITHWKCHTCSGSQPWNDIFLRVFFYGPEHVVITGHCHAASAKHLVDFSGSFFWMVQCNLLRVFA